MKKYLINIYWVALFFSMTVLLFSESEGIDVKVSDKVYPVKYTIGAIKLYSESERDLMISKSVDTGTGALKTSDFKTETITQIEQDVIDELNIESINGGRSTVLAEINKRKSKDYNLEKLVDIQKQIDALNQIKADNPTFDLTAKESELSASYIKYKTRYENGQ